MAVHQTRDEPEWFGRIDGETHDHGELPEGTTVVEVFVAPESLSGVEMLERSGVDTSGVWTNSSNTPGCSALVVASVRVGVDVEVVRPRRRLDALAQRCLLDDEYTAWCEEPDRLRAFLQHWTRIEAHLKALGVGIPAGLRTRPSEPWTIVDLDLGAHHLGAVAVESTNVVISVQAVGEYSASDPTPTQRFAHSAVGSVLGAAMVGLGNVMHPREREQAALHAEADGGDPDAQRLELHLDPDDPSASVVTLRSWVDRPTS